MEEKNTMRADIALLVSHVWSWADVDSKVMEAAARLEAMFKKEELMKQAIITALKNHEQEMERYDYCGSNPGVSKDDYEKVADEAIANYFALTASRTAL